MAGYAAEDVAVEAHEVEGYEVDRLENFAKPIRVVQGLDFKTMKLVEREPERHSRPSDWP
jgi:hypothetical protein